MTTLSGSRSAPGGQPEHRHRYVLWVCIPTADPSLSGAARNCFRTHRPATVQEPEKQPRRRFSRIQVMRRAALSLLAALSVAVSGCAGSSNPRVELAVSQASPLPMTAGAARQGAAALNTMGLDLFAELAAPNQNAVISPLSIGVALGMARAGARGTTADEVDEVMHDAAADGHAAWLSSLGRELARRNRTY